MKVYARRTRCCTKKIKIEKGTSLDKILPDIWKTRKFDDLLLRYYNAVYNQNTIDKGTKGYVISFPKKR